LKVKSQELLTSAQATQYFLCHSSARGGSGILLKDKKDCGQAAMTEIAWNVILLMIVLVKVGSE